MGFPIMFIALLHLLILFFCLQMLVRHCYPVQLIYLFTHHRRTYEEAVDQAVAQLRGKAADEECDVSFTLHFTYGVKRMDFALTTTRNRVFTDIASGLAVVLFGAVGDKRNPQWGSLDSLC